MSIRKNTCWARSANTLTRFNARCKALFCSVLTKRTQVSTMFLLEYSNGFSDSFLVAWFDHSKTTLVRPRHGFLHDGDPREMALSFDGSVGHHSTATRVSWNDLSPDLCWADHSDQLTCLLIKLFQITELVRGNAKVTSSDSTKENVAPFSCTAAEERTEKQRQA